MQSLKFLITILAIGLSNSSHAQGVSIEWQRAFGGTEEEKAYSVCYLQDGSIVIAGYTFSNNGDVSGNHASSNGNDFWVIKLDSSGNLIWQKCYGGTSLEEAYSIKQTIDGGFIIAGSASSTDGDVTGLHTSPLPYKDYWVVKTDNMGNIEWQKCYGGTETDVAYDIELTNDGGYILVGEAHSCDGDVICTHFPSFEEAWVVKIDSVGTLQWQKTLGGTGWDTGYSIRQTNDGGYSVGILTGSNDFDITCTHGISDYWLIKLDGIGNIQWSNCYGGSSSDALYSMDLTKDNGFIMAGTADSNDGDVTGSNGLSDIWIVKADSLGNLQWARCFGGTEYDQGANVKTTSDSGAIITGRSYSNDSSAFCNNGVYSDLWALKIDKLGNLEWSKCIGGIREDGGSGIIQTNDMGYVVVGYTRSNDGDVSGNHGGACVNDSCPDYWVVKLSPLGTAVTEMNAVSDFSTYIDGSQNLFINFEARYNDDFILHLLDITGREILRQPIVVVPRLNKQKIHIGVISNGVYLVRLVTKKGSITKKVIKN